jgi:hypothetical protein
LGSSNGSHPPSASASPVLTSILSSTVTSTGTGPGPGSGPSSGPGVGTGTGTAEGPIGSGGSLGVGTVGSAPLGVSIGGADNLLLNTRGVTQVWGKKPDPVPPVPSSVIRTSPPSIPSAAAFRDDRIGEAKARPVPTPEPEVPREPTEREKMAMALFGGTKATPLPKEKKAQSGVTAVCVSPTPLIVPSAPIPKGQTQSQTQGQGGFGALRATPDFMNINPSPTSSPYRDPLHPIAHTSTSSSSSSSSAAYPVLSNSSGAQTTSTPLPVPSTPSPKLVDITGSSTPSPSVSPVLVPTSILTPISLLDTDPSPPSSSSSSVPLDPYPIGILSPVPIPIPIPVSLSVLPAVPGGPVAPTGQQGGNSKLTVTPVNITTQVFGTLWGESSSTGSTGGPVEGKHECFCTVRSLDKLREVMPAQYGHIESIPATLEAIFASSASYSDTPGRSASPLGLDTVVLIHIQLHPMRSRSEITVKSPSREICAATIQNISYIFGR